MSAPSLSLATWRAARDAALRAIPVLLAKGLALEAAALSRRADQFVAIAARRAALSA